MDRPICKFCGNGRRMDYRIFSDRWYCRNCKHSIGVSENRIRFHGIKAPFPVKTPLKGELKQDLYAHARLAMETRK